MALQRPAIPLVRATLGDAAFRINYTLVECIARLANSSKRRFSAPARWPTQNLEPATRFTFQLASAIRAMIALDWLSGCRVSARPRHRRRSYRIGLRSATISGGKPTFGVSHVISGASTDVGSAPDSRHAAALRQPSKGAGSRHCEGCRCPRSSGDDKLPVAALLNKVCNGDSHREQHDNATQHGRPNPVCFAKRDRYVAIRMGRVVMFEVERKAIQRHSLL
jgi:hypothetical protein